MRGIELRLQKLEAQIAAREPREGLFLGVADGRTVDERIAASLPEGRLLSDFRPFGWRPVKANTDRDPEPRDE